MITIQELINHLNGYLFVNPAHAIRHAVIDGEFVDSLSFMVPVFRDGVDLGIVMPYGATKGPFPVEPGTFEWIEEHARNIRNVKGREYATSGLPLMNFDLAASDLNVTPEVVFAIFAAKHWSSILAYCRDPKAVTSEPIEDRISDMINYLMLLYLMVYRRREKS